jgi:hypothetical protein
MAAILSRGGSASGVFITGISTGGVTDLRCSGEAPDLRSSGASKLNEKTPINKMFRKRG